MPYNGKSGVDAVDSDRAPIAHTPLEHSRQFMLTVCSSWASYMSTAHEPVNTRICYAMLRPPVPPIGCFPHHWGLI